MKDFNSMSEQDLKELILISQKPENARMFSTYEIENITDALYKKMGADEFYNWSLEVEKYGLS